MSSPQPLVITSSLTHKRIVQVTLLAWLGYIGLDFLLNAGLLARIIDWQQSGLLTPMQMLKRIPLGYVSFLLATVLLVWLMLRLGTCGWRAGLIFGLKFGLLSAAVGFFGLISISSLTPSTIFLLALQAVPACAVLGAIVGAGFSKKRLRGLVLAVMIFFFLCLVIAAILQNIGNGGFRAQVLFDPGFHPLLPSVVRLSPWSLASKSPQNPVSTPFVFARVRNHWELATGN